MMNIKNHKGFSLIEVLIALFVASLLIVPLFSLYNNVIQQVSIRSHKIEALFLAKKFLFQARKEAKNETTYTKEQFNQEQQKRLLYERTIVSETYPFAPFQMIKERVIVFWKQFGISYREQLVSYRYAPNILKQETERDMQ